MCIDRVATYTAFLARSGLLICSWFILITLSTTRTHSYSKSARPDRGLCLLADFIILSIAALNTVPVVSRFHVISLLFLRRIRNGDKGLLPCLFPQIASLSPRFRLRTRRNTLTIAKQLTWLETWEGSLYKEMTNKSISFLFSIEIVSAKFKGQKIEKNNRSLV